MEGPHRSIDAIANGVADGVRGFMDAAAGAVKNAGKTLMGALDKPFAQVTGKEGPHRIIDRAADGVVDAGTNFIDQGVIGTAKKAGEGIMRALDQPIEQVGGVIEMPKLFKR